MLVKLSWDEHKNELHFLDQDYEGYNLEKDCDHSPDEDGTEPPSYHFKGLSLSPNKLMGCIGKEYVVHLHTFNT